ncbi:uncharacterized protein LOC117175603 [Belonocnema kinseyi]|uniref:uncharacterized protein LOC117175603 n=1 Tax=Belonocnema kinseyi TaxID=2817044 RepID=UPI00143D9464|nr:uncharacterized protein LOC117175603 [Belonocnema kinseyi]
MESLSYVFRVSPNTISEIVRETCTAIWTVLKNSAFPHLMREGWCAHARTFEEKWNFPHCIGAADAKVVLIQATAPPNSGSAYYTYKQRFGINVMAIADAHYRFIIVDMDALGRRKDGGVFKESTMGQRFEQSSLQVPVPEPVDANGSTLPYVLAGEKAFPLCSHMMRPYPRHGHLNRNKQILITV